MKAVREAVRAARMTKGLTIEQAAEIADIEVHHWRYFEYYGKSVPVYFGKICEAVDLDASETLRTAGII
jgi:uncharacterized alkaline shock family protein YloU